MYQLVLRTIDFLTQQKQQKDANASKSKNGDDDIAEGEVGHEMDTFATFFLLLTVGVEELLHNTAAEEQEMVWCRFVGAEM